MEQKIKLTLNDLKVIDQTNSFWAPSSIDYEEWEAQKKPHLYNEWTLVKVYEQEYCVRLRLTNSHNIFHTIVISQSQWEEIKTMDSEFHIH